MFSASMAYAALVSQPIPVDYSATDNEIATSERGKNQPTISLNAPIKNVNLQEFFQNFQTCIGPVGLEMPIMTGTIYGIHNGICHFNLKMKVSAENTESQSVVCYIPIETFLATVTASDAEAISNLNDTSSMLDQEKQNGLAAPELQGSFEGMLDDPQASAFFNSLHQLKPYCVIQKSSKQFENLQQQFQTNMVSTES